MDISGGMPNLIARMLVDWRPGVIDLLPTLPPQWPNGKISGIRVRGGFEVDVEWKGGKLVSATIHSVGGTNTSIGYGERTVDIQLKQGQSLQLNSELRWNQMN
jgi:alpha-L-fucosidase 2